MLRAKMKKSARATTDEMRVISEVDDHHQSELGTISRNSHIR